MANIRFIKPPNDNRIRSFPGTVMMNDVINIPSTAKNESACISAPKINNIIHITTPKRSVNSNATTNDIFTNKNNNGQSQSMYSSANIEQIQRNSRSDFNDNMGGINDNCQISRNLSLQNCYSSFQNDTDQCAFRELLISSSTSSSEKDLNSNTQLASEINDDNFEAIFPQNCQMSYTTDVLPEQQQDTQDNSEEISDFDEFFEKRAHIHKIKFEAATEQMRFIESPKEEDKKMCSITYSCVAASEDELSEVLDEELDQLPEISPPTSVAVASVSQQIPEQVQHEQKKYSIPDLKKQQSLFSSGKPHQKIQAQKPSNRDTRYNQPDTSRLIHRSISEAGLVDNGKVPSFFRSIKDAKIGGHDKIEPFDIEEMTICLGEMDDHSRVNEHRKRAKIAWESGISNHLFEKSLDNVTNAEMMNAAKSPLNKFEAGHFMISRSLSRDSAINDRLRIRRCALADPENMIMRQEVREKIEKEVEKRRSSMVRKISQFFNVHLNLNKEEDLI